MKPIFYRDFWIEYAPPPIPSRSFDWQYVHEGYDGPGDPRHGAARSLDEAKADVDAWHEENEE